MASDDNNREMAGGDGGGQGRPRLALWLAACFVAAFAIVLGLTIIEEGDQPQDPPAIGEEVPGQGDTHPEVESQAGGDDFLAGDEGGDAATGPSGPPPTTGEERTAALAAQSLIEAIDERSGEEVCRLLTSEAVERLVLPEPGNNCADAVDASLGFADPRGFPVWESSNAAGPISAAVSESSTRARVVLTVATRYDDGREPTVEDDILYLVRPDEASAWQISGFGTTLLRAIGTGEIPVNALEPPPGF